MTAKEKFQRFIILFVIAISFFYGGYYYGHRGYLFEIKRNPPKVEILNKSVADQSVDFSLFWRVWDLVSKDYLERPVDPQKMLYGAIGGMVASLGDPYTAFLPPELNDAIDDSLNNSYQGIGAELGFKDEQLIIVSPLDGSPARDAGVLPGDKILEIEGVVTMGISVREAVYKIRGDAGTVSTLTLQRGSKEPFEVKITRGVIKIESVVWEDKGNGNAYIRVSRFGETTNKEWDKAINDISQKMDELDTVILDLRGNPGGYLVSAVYLASEFYSGKPVVIQQSATGEEAPLKATKGGEFEDIPALFVLIDEGSASAAEILAAALKEYAKATLIGTTTFGKGTIQEPRDFEDGSGLHITTAKWLTPTGDWIHKTGVAPDITVERTEQDYENQVDPQLDKALELANEI